MIQSWRKASEEIRQETWQGVKMSFVYFIRAGIDGPIKIGYSSDPQARCESLQSANVIDLHLLGVIPGSVHTEHNLHKRFCSARINREWFNPTKEILEFIKTLQPAPPKNIPAVYVRDENVLISVLCMLLKRIDHNKVLEIILDTFPELSSKS